MTYYIIFYFFELFIAEISNKINIKHIGFLGLIVAIFFSGIRYQVGYDYFSYEYIFDNIEDFYGQIEPGFFWLVFSLKYLDFSNKTIFFLFATLTQLFAYLGLRKISENNNFAFIIYLLIPGLYLNSFSLIRGSLSLSLFIYGVGLLSTERSQLKYLIISVIAILFHVTSLIPVIIFILIYKTRIKINLNNTLLIFVLLSSILISQTTIPNAILGYLAGTRFEAYIEMFEPQSTLKIFAINILGIFIILKSKYIKNRENYSNYFVMWYVGIILYNIFVNFTPVTRITYFFSIFSIPIILLIIKNQKKIKAKLYLGAVVIFYLIALMNSMYNDIMTNSYPNMIDYKTIFTE